MNKQKYRINNVIIKSGAGYFLATINCEEGFLDIYSRDSGYFGTPEEVKEVFPNAIDVTKANQIATENGWI